MPKRRPPMPRRAETLGVASAARRAWLGAGAALAFVGSAAAAPAFDLGALMALLGRVRSGEATFVETRRVEMLDRTLMSSGRLSFRAPDTFVRETLKPRHEKLAVDGNTLTMTMGERSRTMQLDASPEASVIVEAVRGTLTGNRGALERLFEATVSGAPERWTLELVPRDLRLRGQVQSVRIAGREATVREVQVLLADGDRSLMTIEPAAGARATP
jgi:outer membrane lipoprotein-sorting protein